MGCQCYENVCQYADEMLFPSTLQIAKEVFG